MSFTNRGPNGPLLVDQLRFMASEHPDDIGYVNFTSDAEAALSFGEWEALSNQIARWLIENGVTKGARVAVYLRSEHCFEWISSYAGVHKAGAVMVPVNTRLSLDETRTILSHAEPAAIITDSELEANTAVIASELDIAAVLCVGACNDSHHDWSDLESFDTSEIQIPLGYDDIADIMYTSGTTGLPKGVLVRHRNIAMIANNAPRWTGNGWLHGAPLFTFAGMSFVYNPMKMGLAGWYLPKFNVDHWLDIAVERAPMMCMLVPAMAELLVASPRFEDADLSSFLAVSIGSAPLAPATLSIMQAKMPMASVTNSYGLTEAGPAYIVMPKDEAAKRIGSVGKPMPPMEVKVLNQETDEPCSPNETGELLVRLDGKGREYYKNEEATSSAWTPDGWLRTGDLAHLDDDGFVYINGRIKDMIIRGGNNIYATDVEAVLLENKAVQEAAVVGVPHKVLGEDVGAFIVVVPGATIDSEELSGFCAERLADYKRPRHLYFVTELPRNATGKVMKHKLREQLSNGGASPS